MPLYRQYKRTEYDKTNEMICAPGEDSHQPGHPPSWCTVWRMLGTLPIYKARSEDSGQSGWRMPRMILVFAGSICDLVGFVMLRLIIRNMSISLYLFVYFARVDFCPSLPLGARVGCGLWLWHSLDFLLTFEPRHDKTNKITVRPAKTQISLGIRSVWSESSLSAWRKLGSLATH